MPKILLDRTIQYNRQTYKMGETVEISVENVESLSQFGKIIEEEQPKEIKAEQFRKSTRKNTKKVGT